MQFASRLSFSPLMAGPSSLLARLARVPKPPLSWEIKHGPFFENEVATLDLRGREALIRLERTPLRQMRLECADETRLT